MKYSLSLMFAALVCILTACEHKPLILPDDATARVKVEFDWAEVAPEDIPDDVTLYFYPTAGAHIEKNVPTGQSDHFVTLPCGSYQMLVTVGSEELVTPHPSSIATHSLTLNENPGGVIGQILGTASSAYNEPINYPAPIAFALDPIYAFIIERVELPEGSSTTTIVVKPRRVTARYNITINNFQVDANMAKVWGGAISGLNGALLPGLTLTADKCQPVIPTPIMTQPFLLNWDGSKVATATAYTFGTPDTNQRQLLYIYIWSDQASLLAQTYDVTKIIADAPDPMNVDIVIDFLGFDMQDNQPYTPGVSDFEDEEEQIIVM